jgi:hypothetical protein
MLAQQPRRDGAERRGQGKAASRIRGTACFDQITSKDLSSALARTALASSTWRPASFQEAKAIEIPSQTDLCA